MNRKEKINPLRRRFVGSLAYSAFAINLALPGRAMAESIAIKVWKSPTCGCCKDWIRHLESNGFSVTSYDEGNSEARARLGMPIRFGSCHTGEIEGYAIEGHVPAKEIYRLLDEMEPVAEPEAGFRPVKSLYYWPLGGAFVLALFLAIMNYLAGLQAARNRRAEFNVG
jgi:hypothetical protein